MSKKNYDDYENDMDFVEEKKKKPNKKQHKNHSSEKKAKSSNNNHKNNKVNKDFVAKKKKPKRSFKAKFFMFLTTILVIGCICVTAFLVCFYLGVFEEKVVDTEKPKDKSITSAFTEMITPTLPERTTFLIAGTDKDGSRTDTIMMGCYNSVLEELTIISIPRDTLVYVDDETYEQMNEYFPEPGQHGMKINALRHYGTKGDDPDAKDYYEPGMNHLRKWAENTAGTKIDYMAVVSFDAFTYIIDEIGGIEYDVPMRMYYRCDDLLIDLQPGLQTLNGEQAEGLVRFRHDYVNGDIGRVEQQQNFMKELIKQLANKDTILSKPVPFITAFFKYVDTDMSIADATKFVSVFKNFNAENVVTYTLPGDVGSLYGISGGWIMNENETAELFHEIFVQPSSEIKAEREAAAAKDQITAVNSSKFNDKDLEIQVLNGSYTNGIATKTLTELTSLGYKAMSVGDFTGQKTNNTRIYVKEDGMAQTLVDNFKDTEVIVDTNVDYTEKYDIVIVLGIGEGQ
ncbi:MAG: LCP family protein [Lachnospirales bacterium]